MIFMGFSVFVMRWYAIECAMACWLQLDGFGLP